MLWCMWRQQVRRVLEPALQAHGQHLMRNTQPLNKLGVAPAKHKETVLKFSSELCCRDDNWSGKDEQHEEDTPGGRPQQLRG